MTGDMLFEKMGWCENPSLLGEGWMERENADWPRDDYRICDLVDTTALIVDKTQGFILYSVL